MGVAAKKRLADHGLNSERVLMAKKRGQQKVKAGVPPAHEIQQVAA